MNGSEPYRWVYHAIDPTVMTVADASAALEANNDFIES